MASGIDFFVPRKPNMVLWGFDGMNG